MSQKTGLITGANSGIGKEIAIGLAKSGAHVILVCRNAEKGEAARQEIITASQSTTIDVLIADLSSQSEIRSLAETVKNRYQKLDVLINNAGIVLTDRTLSVDGIEMTLATNHLGPFLLTHLLLDLLKKSSPARVINVSSAIQKWASIDLNDLQFERRKYRFMKAYAQSKLLMNCVTFEFANRLQGTGITMNCIHPGAVKTNLGSSSAQNIVLKWIDRLIKSFFISPQKAALHTINLATSPEMNTISGKFFVRGKPVAANPIAYDPTLSKQVWDISEKLVSLTK